MRKLWLAPWMLWAGVLVEGSAGHPAASAPSTRASEAEMRALVRDLSNDSFKVREAAQRELERIRPDQRDLLQRLSEEVSDEEARARLLSRVAQIDEQLAIDPAPVTLRVAGASLPRVMEELRRATGMSIDVWPGGREGEIFTVDMTERPFWDLYAELNRQHPLTPRNSNGFTLAAQGWGIRNFWRSGGFIVYAQQLTRTRTFNPQADPGQQMGAMQTTISLGAAADPRITVIRYGPPAALELKDSLGRSIWKDSVDRSGIWYTADRGNIWSHSVTVNLPEKLSEKQVTVTGAVKFVVQVAQQQREVANIDQHLGEAITVGGRSLSFERFDVTASSIALAVQDRGNLNAGLNRPDSAGMRLTIVDADNKTIWSTSLTGAMTGTVGATFRQPLKAVLATPLKSAEVTVRFELKDIPLPK